VTEAPGTAEPAFATPAGARDVLEKPLPRWTPSSFSRPAMFAVSILLSLGIWWVIARIVDQPVFFPSPLETWRGAVDLIHQGLLQKSIQISLLRILVGWAIGCGIGIPLGLLMGRIVYVRMLLEPYVEFFRFVPPIAFLTLAVTWFGLGETAKIVLIVWTTLFIVAISTMLGVLGVDSQKIEAGRSLGASELQVFRTVTIPATIPHIVTGMKLAMGNSFMTVVSAEMIAANAGVGWLIFNSRLYLLTSWIFVGIITLGLMGLATDFLFRVFVKLFLRKYDVKV
jgi:ABC-type nitrate/sulfonate/bicarbonate transport system permease component